MHHPIQMKPADTENRNGKVTITVFAGSSAGDVLVSQLVL